MKGQLKAAVAAVLPLLFAIPGTAQTGLELSVPNVLLSNSEAKSIKVTAVEGGARKYTISDKPDWLTIWSSNQYTTPDTLFFQLGSSICGTCTASVRLSPMGGGPAASVEVKFASEATPLLMLLAVNPTAVNLNSTEARAVQVAAPKGAVITYTLKNVPPWLSVTTAHNYMTPDTLYFRMANSNCGACTASLELLGAGSNAPTVVPVTYGMGAGASFKATPAKVSLTYPAAPGATCGAGYMSRCSVALSSTGDTLKTYSAKIPAGAGDAWLLLNEKPDMAGSVPIGNGLTLSVNANAAASMATGSYAGQVMVFNPAKAGDLIMLDVTLLVNPGKITIAPDTGTGSKQSFTIQAPHPGGSHNWSVVNVLFNNGLDLVRGCYLAYVPAAGILHLTDDLGNLQGDAGEFAQGESRRNGQCEVRFVSAKSDGNLLTLALDVTFAAAFSGKKMIYLAARDREQNNSGWLPSGTWEVRPPAAPVRKKGPAVKKK